MLKQRIKKLLLTIPCSLFLGLVISNSVSAVKDKHPIPFYNLVIGGTHYSVLREIGNGAIVEQRDEFGRTPLHYAAMYGKKANAEVLIGIGHADVLAVDNENMTPLHYAAKNGRASTAEWLLRNGGAKACINARDIFQKTPLHYAAESNSYNTVLHLIGSGADILARDHQGKTPLDYAKENTRSIIGYHMSRRMIGEGAKVSAVGAERQEHPVAKAKESVMAKKRTSTSHSSTDITLGVSPKMPDIAKQASSDQGPAPKKLRTVVVSANEFCAPNASGAAVLPRGTSSNALPTAAAAQPAASARTLPTSVLPNTTVDRKTGALPSMSPAVSAAAAQPTALENGFFDGHGDVPNNDVVDFAQYSSDSCGSLLYPNVCTSRMDFMPDFADTFAPPPPENVCVPDSVTPRLSDPSYPLETGATLPEFSTDCFGDFYMNSGEDLFDWKSKLFPSPSDTD